MVSQVHPRMTAATCALGLALLALAGCSKPDAAAAGKKEQEVKLKAVETMKLTPRAFEEEFVFPGVTEPIETRMIAAESGGRVLAAPFEEGTTIKRGALLLRVDTRTTAAQINVLKAQLKSAETQVSTARREVKRTKALASQGLATPQQLDQATAQLEMAERSVDQAKMGIRQAQVGQSMGTVRSAVSGHVVQKRVREGEFVGAGTPIAQVIDYGTIVVKVTVPESAVPFIKEGGKVKIYFPSLDDKEFIGTVKRRGVTVVQPTQTFPVEIHIPNEGMELLPGMRTRVVVPRRTYEGAIVVPRDALLEGVSRKEAMIVKDGKAELHVVEIGAQRGGDVVVTKGLAAGDELIVQGHRSIVDGSPVRVVRQRKEAVQ